MLCLALLGWSLSSFAQKQDEEITFPLDHFYAKRVKSPFRSVLKNFVFSLSTGVGNTFMSHKLDGFGISQIAGEAPLIFPADGSNRFSSWVNLVRSDIPSTGPDSFTVSSDTTKLGFKGNALNIPLKFTVHYEFLERYRVGGGLSFEAMTMGDFNPTNYKDRIETFRPYRPTGLMKKYFVVLGVSFYRWNGLLFTGDANVGAYNPGNNFARSLIKKGVFANVGVTVEKDLSEYIRVFARPSFEIKNYTLSVPGSNDRSIVHNMNAFYLNVGLSYRIPELPKCYHPDCHAQINHAHGNKEYRSRMHPFYKKQNPHYGENYRKLIKEKRKNRKKLNPY